MNVLSLNIILFNASCTFFKHSDQITSDSLKSKLDNNSKISKENNGISFINENSAGLHHQDNSIKENFELIVKNAFELLSTLLKKNSTKFVLG